MSVLFQTVINTGKLNSLRKTLNTSCKCVFLRKFSDVPRKFVSFDEVVAQRRAEARRSLVIQVNSESSFNELYGYCSKYAEINGIHHFKNLREEHFMLIEFSTEENYKDVLQSCTAHQKNIEIMALQSPFLWFRAATGTKEKYIIPSTKSLITKDGSALNEDVLLENLMKCENVSDQIQLLYDNTVLNDLGVKLRYMVARQLEMVFESLYANIAVRPFGSSVNGFGKMGCDLDLVLTNVLTKEMCDGNKRFVYQEKESEKDRGFSQRHMALMSEVLELRAPGASRVVRILHAKVPIVKFTHDYADVHCDLAYNNMSGVYMSELLWLYGSLDPRVRPLAFAVRRWAQTVGLTNPHPGRWITNFPLTLMVLFFLQQKSKDGAILPSLKYLVGRAGEADIRIAEDNINCTFLRDMNKLPVKSYGQNQANLETLLLQFFEYYAHFDFHNKGISINEGVPIRKPNSYPLYIMNPLEQALNVSKNVSYEECERLKMEVRNAAWQLESGLEGGKSDDWGILGLLEKRTTRDLKKLIRVGNSHKLISIKDLFKEDDENEKEISDNRLKTKLESLTQKCKEVEITDREVEISVKKLKDSMMVKEKGEQKDKFKNSQIANEVHRIKRNKIL